jgi:xanthine dehydrogenase accessory factor
MTDITFQLNKIKEQGQPFALCIVVQAQGSTPRKEGAKMVVFADGRTLGTVGGGSIEMRTIEDAIKCLETGNPALMAYNLETDLNMQCGGKVTMYFEPFLPELCLTIFGVGHIGREVGVLAKSLGFKVRYVDNRENIFSEFDSTHAECIVGDYMEKAGSIAFSPNDLAIITTQGHGFDEDLLGILATKDLLYLGMIGSKRKVAKARQRYLDSGQLTEEQLNKVEMPMGVPFNAQTPREIAISIVARLIDVKNSRNQ